jgi:hypothetical protein
LQVKEYLVVEAFPEKPIRLWFARPISGERPVPVSEARLETIGVLVRAKGKKSACLILKATKSFRHPKHLSANEQSDRNWNEKSLNWNGCWLKEAKPKRRANDGKVGRQRC